MNAHTKGWLGFLAALGMMAGLLAPEVGALESWSAAFSLAFAGKALAHFGVVTGAFVAGKLIPTR